MFCPWDNTVQMGPLDVCDTLRWLNIKIRLVGDFMEKGAIQLIKTIVLKWYKCGLGDLSSVRGLPRICFWAKWWPLTSPDRLPLQFWKSVTNCLFWGSRRGRGQAKTTITLAAVRATVVRLIPKCFQSWSPRLFTVQMMQNAQLFNWVRITSPTQDTHFKRFLEIIYKRRKTW